MKKIYLNGTAILAVSLLAACGGQSETGASKSAAHDNEIVHINDIPHAQLSGNVVPQEYRVDMRMDPDATGFSGTVEIDVDVQKATDKIWLHGKEMTVGLSDI